MRNHYIPRYYLKGFAIEPALSQIWCFEKGSGRSFPTNLINVELENNLYFDEVEKYLTEKIEQPCVTVFKKIQNRDALTIKEQEYLTDYIVLLMIRGPIKRDKIQHDIEVNSESYFDELKKWLEDQSISDSEFSAKAKDFLGKLPQVREKGINSNDVWQQILISEKFSGTKMVISSMNWQFFLHRDRVFLTSDNPVFFTSRIGLANVSAELVFPITSRIALFLSWRKKWKNQYESPSDGIVKQINWRTVKNATKFFYSHNNAEWKKMVARNTNIGTKPLIL